jgi:hypothetical protein
MSLFLQTFGPPALRGERGDVRLNAKELALLAYLRVTGRSHTRGAIGQLLWGNISIGRNHSVNTAISALRRALPEGALPPGADPVMLGADLPCDVDEVLAATSETGHPEALLRSLEVCRTPFLDGFEFQIGEGAQGFIAWMQERRAALSLTLAEALEEQIAAAAGAQDWESVRVLAKAGRESLPAWRGNAQWTNRASRARTRFWTALAGTALASCVILLVLHAAASGSARPCGPGEARAQLVRQTYPAEANQAIREGERYTPAWYLKNVGSCAWRPGAQVARVAASGPASLNAEVAVRTIHHPVQPNQVVKVDIRMRGPKPAGSYGEDWVLLDGLGKPVAMVGGATLQVRFQVLPERVPTCLAGEVAAELFARSHPRSNMRVRPGERIPVSWTLTNSGNCAWDSSVSLRFREASGPRLSDSSVSEIRLSEMLLPTLAHTFHVPMRAPQADSSYLESWELVGPDGRPVRVSDASGVDVRIVVSRTEQIRATDPDCTIGDELVAFITSETVRDGSTLSPSVQIPKEWTLLNIGDCTWPAGALRLKHVRSLPEFPHPFIPEIVTTRPVPPTGTYTFQAPFMGPSAPGHYCVYWQMYNRAGDSVQISQTWRIWADFNVRTRATDVADSKHCSREAFR